MAKFHRPVLCLHSHAAHSPLLKVLMHGLWQGPERTKCLPGSVHLFIIFLNTLEDHSFSSLPMVFVFFSFFFSQKQFWGLETNPLACLFWASQWRERQMIMNLWPSRKEDREKKEGLQAGRACLGVNLCHSPACKNNTAALDLLMETTTS